jgi:hypothetical protein
MAAAYDGTDALASVTLRGEGCYSQL